MILTYGFDTTDTIAQGGYSDDIVVRQEFVVIIPNDLPLAAAAPLLCAGITTCSSLRHWIIKAGDLVGVVGLNSLGGMAVKFAKTFGAHVVVLTTSSELDLSKSTSAKKVVVTSDPASIGGIMKAFALFSTRRLSVCARPQPITFTHCSSMVCLLVLPPKISPPTRHSGFSLIFGRRSLRPGFSDRQHV
jgi:alcohol dehydrogenase (NADP+)